MVSIEIARSPAKLRRNGRCLQHGQLTFEAIDEHHNLLAQTGRGCRLAMCLGQHRDSGPLVSISLQLGYEFFKLRIIDLVERILDRQGHGRVVNVLRRQSEVDEFLVSLQAANAVKLLFYKIFHGFHIVVCHALDFLHAGSVSF